MKALTSLTAAVLVLASFHASAADSYTASIQGCQKAISDRLGVTDADFSVKKIQSSPRCDRPEVLGVECHRSGRPAESQLPRETGW